MEGDLGTLARLFDVRTSYVDAAGRTAHPSPDTVRAVLAALGVDVDDPSAALRAEQLRRHSEVVQPVNAVPSLGAQAVAVSLPRSLHPRDCWLSMQGEDGEVSRSRLLPVIQRPLGSANVGGVARDRYEVLLSSPLRMLAPGYYRLRVEAPGLEASSLVVVAPRCPVPERGWGAFMPLHSVRSASDWGVGNYPALRSLGQWLARLGGGFVGVLPLYPFLTSPAAGAEVSPYLPATRLGWNELFVDPLAVPELDASSDARDLLASPAFAAALARARSSPLVDYEGSAALVRSVLEPLSRELFASASSRRDELAAFARQRPDLVAYAEFRAAREHGTPPPQARTAARGTLPDDPAARYHLYAQWVAEHQLADAGDRLFLDLPIGVHPEGFDPLYEPGSFAEGVEGGAPPDAFQAGGQRWAFRPLHPIGVRAQGYRHVVSVLRHAMRRAKVLRLDHVMGLYRLWWVPRGAEAAEGCYVGYRDEELRAIVALEAHRARTSVVGEDLGTVPDEVRAGMTADRMLRSWVFQFEVSADAPLPEPPEMAMASLGTHDLPRFAVYFEQPEVARWRRALGGDARRALRGALDHLAASPARLVLVDIEDLWLERSPHNRPGTGVEAANWRHRCLRTLDELCADDEVAGALARVDSLRRQEEEKVG